MMNQAIAAAVDDGSEIYFAEGIIGVPRARRFQLLAREDSQLYILRCMDIPGFNLPVIDPYVINTSFGIELGQHVSAALHLAEDDPVLVLAIATLQPQGASANLRAPLVINASRSIGAQVILDDSSLALDAPVPLQFAGDQPTELAGKEPI